MALIFVDGFEKHGPSNPNVVNLWLGGASFDLAFQSLLLDWAIVSTGGNGIQLGITTGRAGVPSKSLVFYPTFAGSGSITRILPATYSRLIIGVAINSTQLNNNVGFTFLSNGTAQTALYIDSLGKINVSRGGIGALSLFQSSALVVANAWHYYELDVTFNGSTGHFQVWLDGVSVTNSNNIQNTSSSTAIDGLQFSVPSTGGSGTGMQIDDLYVCDTTGTLNNAALGDMTVDTLFPIADTAQKDFSPTAYAVGFYARQTNAQNAPGGNNLILVPVTPEVNCTLSSVSFTANSFTTLAKLKGVIYSNISGNPGSLLSDGTEVIGTTTGESVVLPLASPQSLTANTQYWIGYYSDTGFTLNDSEATLNKGQKKANTYGSGAAAGPLSGMTTGQPTWQIWGNCTSAASNFALMDQVPGSIVSYARTVNYVQSSTIGAEDLYALSALPFSPRSIAGVQLTALLSKDVAGARTADLRIKSGTVDSAGSASGFAPPTTTPVYFRTIFETDPQVPGLPWGAGGVNAIKAGVKVAS